MEEGDDTVSCSPRACVTACHTAWLRAASINGSAFLNIFAGRSNESPGTEREEEKGVAVPPPLPRRCDSVQGRHP